MASKFNKKLSSGKAAEFIEQSKENLDDLMVANTKLINLSLLQDHPDNEELNGYDSNTIDNLVKSIKEYGFNGKIVVYKKSNSEKYTILSGHQRVLALRILGYETVDCYVLDNKLEEWKLYEYLIISNYGTCRASNDDYYVAKNILAYKEKVLPYKQKSIECVKDEKGNIINDSASALAKIFGISRISIIHHTNIAKLIDDIVLLIKEKKLTIRKCVSIFSLSDVEQKQVAAMINDYLKETKEESCPTEVIKKFVNKITGKEEITLSDNTFDVESDNVQDINDVTDVKERKKRITKTFSDKLTEVASMYSYTMQKNVYEDKESIENAIVTINETKEKLMKDIEIELKRLSDLLSE